MLIDDHLVLFDNVPVTANGQISDVIDRGAESPTLAAFGPGFAGMPLYLVLQTSDAFNGNSGAFTGMTVSLLSDSTPNLATTPTEHLRSGAFPVANLGANRVLAVIGIPATDYERYIGLRINSSGATGIPSAGKIRGFLTTTPAQWQAMEANNPRAFFNPPEEDSEA